MKVVILLFALVGLCTAFPPSLLSSLIQPERTRPIAQILRYDANLGTPTGFSYAVEQSDDQKQSVIGEIRNAGTDEESLAVKGEYSYVGDDGITYAVHYIADENGFQPSGEHIPAAASIISKSAASTSRNLGVKNVRPGGRLALASLVGGGLG